MGADDVAGSSPQRRNKKGSIAPLSEPHRTTPTSAIPTVRATQPMILTVVKDVQVLPQRDPEKSDRSKNEAER